MTGAQEQVGRCGRCQAELMTGARFCAACGAPVDDAAAFDATAPATSSLPPLRLEAGTLLREIYRVESVLGEGGMGVVCRAHDLARDPAVPI